MKHLLLAIIASTAAGISAASAQVQTTSFTTSEGYTDTYLGGQPSSGSTWNTGGGYVVDTSSGGSVSISTTAGNYAPPAIYQAPSPLVVGATLTYSMDFTFSGLDTVALGAERAYVAELALGSNPGNVYSFTAEAALAHFEFQSSDYGVQLFSGQIGTVSAASLGLAPTGGTTSAPLRLTLALTVAPAGASTYLATLTNLSTSTDILTLTGTTDVSAFSNLYPIIQGGGSNSQATTFTTTEIQFGIPAEVPEPQSTSLLVLGGGVLAFWILRRNRLSHL